MAKRKSASDRPVGRALRRRRGEPTTSTSHVPNFTQAGMPEPQESVVQQDPSVFQYQWVSCSPVAESSSESPPYSRVQFDVDRQSAQYDAPPGVPSEMHFVFPSSNLADEMTTNGAIPSNDIVPNPQGDVPHGVASEVDPVIDDNHPDTVDAGPLDGLDNNPQDDIALAIPSDTRCETQHSEENPVHGFEPLDGLDNYDMPSNGSGVQGRPFAMFQYTTGSFSSPVPSSRCPSWDSQTTRSTSVVTPLSFESPGALPPMTDVVVGPSSSGSALNIDLGRGNEYLAQYTDRVPSIEYPAEPNHDQYSTNNSSAYPLDFWNLIPPTSNQELLPDDPENWGHGSLTATDDIGMAQYEDNLVNPDLQEVDEDPYLNDIRAHGH